MLLLIFLRGVTDMRVLDKDKLKTFIQQLTIKLDYRYDERYNDNLITDASIKKMISNAITKNK